MKNSRIHAVDILCGAEVKIWGKLYYLGANTEADVNL